MKTERLAGWLIAAGIIMMCFAGYTAIQANATYDDEHFQAISERLGYNRSGKSDYELQNELDRKHTLAWAVGIPGFIMMIVGFGVMPKDEQDTHSSSEANDSKTSS